jgi:hypothetical protein
LKDLERQIKEKKEQAKKKVIIEKKQKQDLDEELRRK